MFIKKKSSAFIACLLCFIVNVIYAQQNILTPQEKKDGWKLLFNGKDLSSWHSYLQKTPGNGWKVEDEAIFINQSDKTADNIDLTTDEEFENFDLKLEFKTDTCANSGVMFYVHESPEYQNSWETGPEMQIDDVECGPDHLHPMNRMGTLYDLYPVDSEYIGVSGKWYQFEIKANKGHVELFEEGHKVVDATLWNQHWKDLIAAVKFKDIPGFGTFKKGRIAFQGTENGKIWFRNIKIKQI